MQKLTEIQTQRQHLCTEEQCPYISASLEVSTRKIGSYRGALAGLGGKAMKSRIGTLCPLVGLNRHLHCLNPGLVSEKLLLAEAAARFQTNLFCHGGERRGCVLPDRRQPSVSARLVPSRLSAT